MKTKNLFLLGGLLIALLSSGKMLMHCDAETDEMVLNSTEKSWREFDLERVPLLIWTPPPIVDVKKARPYQIPLRQDRYY